MATGVSAGPAVARATAAVVTVVKDATGSNQSAAALVTAAKMKSRIGGLRQLR